MSDSPYFNLRHMEAWKDASKYYLDYLRENNIDRDNPKHYKTAKEAYIHACDWVQFWVQYPSLGDTVQIKKPQNAIPRNILAH